MNLAEVKKATATGMYKCNFCEKEYTNENNFLLHMFKEHETFTYCYKCSKFVETGLGGLKEHMKQHSVNARQCRCCASFWTNLTAVLAHRHQNTSFSPSEQLSKTLFAREFARPQAGAALLLPQAPLHPFQSPGSAFHPFVSLQASQVLLQQQLDILTNNVVAAAPVAQLFPNVFNFGPQQ